MCTRRLHIHRALDARQHVARVCWHGVACVRIDQMLGVQVVCDTHAAHTNNTCTHHTHLRHLDTQQQSPAVHAVVHVVTALVVAVTVVPRTIFVDRLILREHTHSMHSFDAHAHYLHGCVA
jgi:hypothetical protein